MNDVKRKRNNLFQDGSVTSSFLEVWWNKLQQARGDRAELRRSNGVQMIAFLPVYFRFLSEFREAMKKDGYQTKPNPERIQAVLGLLSHVKKPVSGSIGDLMARSKKGSDTPRVSDTRFRKILRLDTIQDYYSYSVRLLKLMDGEVNPANLAYITYFWGEKIKRILAYQYYGHGDLLVKEDDEKSVKIVE